LHVLRTYLYTYLCGRLSYLTILGSQWWRTTLYIYCILWSLMGLYQGSQSHPILKILPDFCPIFFPYGSFFARFYPVFSFMCPILAYFCPIFERWTLGPGLYNTIL
jgi:hypothetical protein